jgi:hypothetical protein
MMMKKSRKLLVTLGQDTPAYADLDIDVPADATPDRIIEIAKEKAIHFVGADENNLQFIPTGDWTGLRIVAITEQTSEGFVCLAEDVSIEPSGEDLGIVAKGVLTGTVPAGALLHEAERQGISVCPRVKTLLADADVVQTDDGVQIHEFTPFTLVVDAFACASDGDAPLYAAVTMTPALLGEIVRIARIAKDAEICLVHIDADDGVWNDTDESLRMWGTDLVVMPSRGALKEASFFWQGHPKHADYNCETRAIDVDDLLACMGNSEPKLPNGFRRDRGVLFYDADSGAMDDLIKHHFDEERSDPSIPVDPWVIYHASEFPEARFWSMEDGWVNLAGATRFAEMPLAPYPMGGPEFTQAGVVCIGTMKPYTVMYAAASTMETAFAFGCFAEDEEHAIEQALDANPGVKVQSVLED